MTGRRRSGPVFHPPAISVAPAGVVLSLVIVGIHALIAGTASQAVLFESFGLNPITVRAGGWELLFTHIFLHGSWPAALVNAAFVLICGGVVERAMGQGVLGALSFLTFFLICGVASGLVFCLLHAHENITVVGASGTMCGLMGAAIRLPILDETQGRGKGFSDPRVLVLTVLLCIYSAVVALSRGAAGQPRQEMDWEGHLAGYAIGLLLIEPWLRVFHHRYFTTS